MLHDKIAINNCFIDLVEILIFNIDINIIFKIILLLKKESNADQRKIIIM